jgi:hypothetical protein
MWQYKCPKTTENKLKQPNSSDCLFCLFLVVTVGCFHSTQNKQNNLNGNVNGNGNVKGEWESLRLRKI